MFTRGAPLVMVESVDMDMDMDMHMYMLHMFMCSSVTIDYGHC